MIRPLALLPAAFAPVFAPAAAHAQEVFAGVLAHGVDTPLTRPIGEDGVDFQLGIRGDPVAGRGTVTLRPYALGSVNTRGDTSFLSAGLAIDIALKGWFIRPALGLAVHDGPGYRVGADDYRTDLGSRVLLQPEIGVGVALSPRVSVEVQWTHLSHAQLFSSQNPGLDMIGARLSYRLRRK